MLPAARGEHRVWFLRFVYNFIFPDGGPGYWQVGLPSRLFVSTLYAMGDPLEAVIRNLTVEALRLRSPRSRRALQLLTFNFPIFWCGSQPVEEGILKIPVMPCLLGRGCECVPSHPVVHVRWTTNSGRLVFFGCVALRALRMRLRARSLSFWTLTGRATRLATSPRGSAASTTRPTGPRPRAGAQALAPPCTLTHRALLRIA